MTGFEIRIGILGVWKTNGAMIGRGKTILGANIGEATGAATGAATGRKTTGEV